MTTHQQFLIYQSEDGSTRIDVMLNVESLWLNQKQLTELFGKAKGTISEHIKHIFEDGEQDENSVVRYFRTTAADGKQYEVAHYNLDMILSLGFRVRSPVGVRFRRWANDKLKEYLVRGFVMDDSRLKNPGKGLDYLDELTRRLQDIRTFGEALANQATAEDTLMNWTTSADLCLQAQKLWDKGDLLRPCVRGAVMLPRRLRFTGLASDALGAALQTMVNKGQA